MNLKTYTVLRRLITFTVGLIVAMATVRGSYLLALTGIVTGCIFLVIVRSKAGIKIDERDKLIREKAAQMAYAIFTPTLAIGTFLIMFPTLSDLSVFANGEFTYLESLGVIFAYLTLFLITVYAISYHFINRKFSGGNEE
ncbi:DUF2178 domain-containing protein [Candidatus Woesebacteria bacterium]|nr:MAG: DUF2178 domain-containing protein [Candidatus Woesebacteria bacterium]